MGLGKRIKAGDVLYIGDVRIQAKKTCDFLLDADKSIPIIYATEAHTGQEAMNMTTHKPKE